jgi:ribosome-binding ATPase YchF (GTP1/OBG family)
VSFSEEEAKMLSSYGLLSRKPQLIVINQSEDQPPLDIEVPFAKTHLISHTSQVGDGYRPITCG